MGRRCRQILLFVAAFSFLSFLSEGHLRIEYIGDLFSSGNKSDDSGLATTPTIPFSEVRKTALKGAPLGKYALNRASLRKTALIELP